MYHFSAMPICHKGILHYFRPPPTPSPRPGHAARLALPTSEGMQPSPKTGRRDAAPPGSSAHAKRQPRPETSTILVRSIKYMFNIQLLQAAIINID